MIGKNNPFNVRYSRLNKWKGQTGQTKGFCDFSSMQYGVRAAAYLIMVSYRKRGLKTYAELITAFAPPQENDTKFYIDFVTPKGKFPFDCPSTLDDFAHLLVEMSKMEGYELSILYVKFVLNRYFKDNSSDVR